jgi:hypothetical protein
LYGRGTTYKQQQSLHQMYSGYQYPKTANISCFTIISFKQQKGNTAPPIIPSQTPTIETLTLLIANCPLRIASENPTVQRLIVHGCIRSCHPERFSSPVGGN